MTIELVSELNPDECIKRLSDAMDSPLTSIFGKNPVIGRMEYGYISLTKRIWYRNSFQTQLSGRFENEGSGTRVIATAGMQTWVRIFLIIFCLVPLAILANLITTGEEVNFVTTALAILFPVIGVLLMFLGRYLARKEENFLIDFVCQVIEAKRVK